MAWAAPEYSRDQVNAAAKLVRTTDIRVILSDEWDIAFSIMSNWRTSHLFPLNTFKINLRKKALAVDEEAFVAQRLKRTSSIVKKLNRFSTMRLTQMQDIGGCRAVVSTIDQVYELTNKIKDSRIKHKLVNEKDYIKQPKQDGYRGIHIIYKYQSDRKETYNNHCIEIQIRTRLQHAWATAVETISTLTGQGLKSEQGEAAWKEFFALVGKLFAVREGAEFLYEDELNEIRKTVRATEIELRVIERLTAFQRAMKEFVENPALHNAKYFLMVLNAQDEQVIIRAYTQSQYEQAASDYSVAERGDLTTDSKDTVLVVTDSVYALRTAYPNYFGDTALFLANLRQFLA